MSKPSQKVKLISMCILILVVLNLSYISLYLLKNNPSTIQDESVLKMNIAISHDSSRQGRKSSQQDVIALELNIMDIYRLDVSCEYITQALSGKISTKYKMENVESCSTATKSVFDDGSSTYKPIVNESAIDYDPFSMITTVHDAFNDLEMGGVWTPKLCSSRVENVIFIVPFSRSRLTNLKLFLVNMHSYLQRVQYPFRYRILIAEQINTSKNGENFNKGRLYNTAFRHIVETYSNVDCVVLHDVDIVPRWDASQLGEPGDYRCRLMPWHLTRKVLQLDSNSERVYNQFLTGGVLSLQVKHFTDVNGFSNRYFGWGAEDDDFQLRMFNSQLCIMRPNVTLESLPAPFLMLPHEKTNANKKRFSMLSTALSRQHQDGLNDIKSLTHIINVTFYKPFTHLAIKVIE